MHRGGHHDGFPVDADRDLRRVGVDDHFVGGPIRRFAAVQLADPGQTLSHLERYLLGVLDDASRHYGSQDRDMRRLDSEQPNPRAVLAWIAGGRRPAGQLVRALGDVWVWLLARGHLRQSAPLWQQLVSLLAQDPPGDDRMARAWLLAGGWMNQGEFTKAIDAVDEVVPAMNLGAALAVTRVGPDSAPGSEGGCHGPVPYLTPSLDGRAGGGCRPARDCRDPSGRGNHVQDH